MDYISSELVETLTDVLKIESVGLLLELETKQGRGKVMERSSAEEGRHPYQRPLPHPPVCHRPDVLCLVRTDKRLQ